MDSFTQLFDQLKIIEPELQNQIRSVGIIQNIDENQLILEPNKYIKWLSIVLEGKVRVWKEQEDREILLYYVNPIETCVLSLAATYEDCKSTIYAQTDKESILLKIPVRFIKQWSKIHPSWHDFTTQTFINSYRDLLSSYSNLAFLKIKDRLMDYLMRESLSTKNNSVFVSHKKLANEMGTTREVISKTLKKIEQEKRLSLSFKKIVIKNGYL